MKKRILLLFTLALLGCGAVSAQQVQWQSIEQAAKTNTQTNAKLYFVDFYTSWCGWCKKMDRETFTNATVTKILNTYYIPVKFNAEGSSEFTWDGSKYTAPATTLGSRPSTHPFAKKVLGTRMGFPSFVIFRSNQQQLTMIQGYQSADDLVIMLWYFASGAYNHYNYEKYAAIFDKEFRADMNAKLGIK